MGLRSAGLEAKLVILVASWASLSLSPRICRVGTITPTPTLQRAAAGDSKEIKVESGPLSTSLHCTNKGAITGLPLPLTKSGHTWVPFLGAPAMLTE